jgi:predicted nucleic acid-binding protein
VASDSGRLVEIDKERALVVDNTVMMRWLFDDGSPADRRYADRVLETIQAQHLQVIVPNIWVYESAFVVSYYSNKHVLPLADARRHLEYLVDVCTVISDGVTPSALFEVSRLHRISTYDAAYVLLAQNHACSLATLDKKMRRVARKLDIAIALDKSK